MLCKNIKAAEPFLHHKQHNRLGTHLPESNWDLLHVRCKPVCSRTSENTAWQKHKCVAWTIAFTSCIIGNVNNDSDSDTFDSQTCNYIIEFEFCLLYCWLLIDDCWPVVRSFLTLCVVVSGRLVLQVAVANSHPFRNPLVPRHGHHGDQNHQLLWQPRHRVQTHHRCEQLRACWCCFVSYFLSFRERGRNLRNPVFLLLRQINYWVQ